MEALMLKLLSILLLSTNGPECAKEDLAQLVAQDATTKELQPFADNAYASLPITHEEKQKIGKIVITLADNTVFQLLFERKFLERLGQEVHHVHPLRFLGTIFNNPRLVNCMHMIRMSGFKWGGFMDGISERLKGEIRAGNVDAYIPGFAQQLNVQAEDVQAYINHRDIEGLVLFLMAKKR